MPVKRRETSAQDPKSRLCAAGPAALSDVELLGALVGSVEIAGVLIGRFGGLDSLARASLADLFTLPDVGPAVGARDRFSVHFPLLGDHASGTRPGDSVPNVVSIPPSAGQPCMGLPPRSIAERRLNWLVLVRSDLSSFE